MKKVQKVLALLLVFVMVFTTAGMNVAAAGEMDSVAGEADIQSQEQQQILDETDTQQEATQQTSEGILEYVYVDESVVNMPQTQNIAVGFSDENLVLESAVLHYSSVVGSSRIYTVFPVLLRLNSVASLILWASPPDNVVDGCPSRI